MSKPRLLTKFYIRDKQGRKVRFTPNKAQLHYFNHRTGRDLILKARQIGFTTMEQLRKLERTLLKENHTSVTIAHKKQKTEGIFQIAKFAWDNLPEKVRNVYSVRYDNVRELAFRGNGSKYFVDSDARSSTVQDMHVSEVAFMKNLDDFFASALEAVPKDGSITLETTANGLNQFSELWEEAVAGKNEFTPHFYNWTWDDDYRMTPPEDSEWKEEYKDLARRYNLILNIQNDYNLTDDQFYWYFLKARRQRKKVKQEYPTNPQEAFLTSAISVFDLYLVNQLKAKPVLRKYEDFSVFVEPVAGHRYIVGIDTAEGVGNDDTAIRVLDVTDPNKFIEVASFNDSMIRPDQSAENGIKIARLYNNAFIIPERNSSGLSTVLKIRSLGYDNLFTNVVVDKKTNKKKNEFGWRTTAQNRDLMIDDAVEMFEEERLEISCPVTIKQMKTFVRKENGRREHDDGYHDDGLFSLFLAIQGNKYHREKRVFSNKANAF